MDKAQLAKECVAIDEAGGNVREYLASKGFISPWGTWYRLQIEELGRSKNQITEGRGGNEMSKITLEQKKKAVEMAIRGESPLPYLKKCGSTAPDKTWWYIKNKLKDADPELYAQIPDMRKAEPEKPVTCCAPSTREGVEVPDEIPDAPKTLDGSAWEKYAVPAEEARPGIGADVKQAIRAEAPEEKPEPGMVSSMTFDKDGALRMEARRPLEKYGVEVTGLKTRIGEFSISGSENMSWQVPDTKPGYPQIVTVPKKTWKELLEVLPIVMETMNI